MALTVTPTNYTLINECNSAANWTGTSAAAVTDFYKRGTASVGFTLRTAGNNLCYATGTWNLSANKILRMWYMCAAFNNLGLAASGGIQFYILGGGIAGYWNIGGSDTYPGGWHNFVVDLNRAPDEGSQPNMSSVTRVGFNQKMSGTIKNAQNTWADFLHCSDGLSCTDTTDPFKISDIYAVEDTPAQGGWGVMRRISGIYFLTGELQLSGFHDSAEAVVFEDRPVRTNLYSLTGTGDFQTGSEVGGSGVSGLSIRTQRLTQTPKFTTAPSSGATHDFKHYGSSYIDASAITLLAGNANREFLNITFESCSQVTVSSTKIRSSNFISANNTASAVLLPGGNVHDMQSCSFINNNSAVTINTAGTYTFNSLFFYGNVIDVNNTSGGAVVINCTGGSNPSPAKVTGNTTIVNVVSLSLAGIVPDSRVRILAAGTDTILSETDSSGTSYQYEYSYSSDTYVDIVIHHVDYVYYRIEAYLLSSQNAGIPIAQRFDRVYWNP